MHASRTLHRIVAMALVAALSGAPGPASAEPQQAGDAPSAQKLYGSAQKLYDAGKYADALALFRQAYESSKSPNARLMVAACYGALGRNAEAYEEMAATLAEATERAETDAKYRPARDEAAKQAIRTRR
jgi:thioredoxin-like negative regulator of GroEL